MTPPHIAPCGLTPKYHTVTQSKIMWRFTEGSLLVLVFLAPLIGGFIKRQINMWLKLYNIKMKHFKPWADKSCISELLTMLKEKRTLRENNFTIARNFLSLYTPWLVETNTRNIPICVKSVMKQKPFYTTKTGWNNNTMLRLAGTLKKLSLYNNYSHYILSFK